MMHAHRTVKLLLDILQGAGLSTSAGLRPFLPTLAAGGLAAGDAGVDFEGTDFEFLEKPWFLAVLVVALLITIFFRKYFEAGPGAAALTGISIGLGAVLFAGSLADRHETWWYGLIAGGIIALFSNSVSSDLIGRVRARFEAQGDNEAAAALPLYLEGIALIVALASILFPPLSLIALGFLIALFAKGGGNKKFAGLRTLR
jgi:FtsH-binding integral membrane protein